MWGLVTPGRHQLDAWAQVCWVVRVSLSGGPGTLTLVIGSRKADTTRILFLGDRFRRKDKQLQHLLYIIYPYYKKTLTYFSSPFQSTAMKAHISHMHFLRRFKKNLTKKRKKKVSYILSRSHKTNIYKIIG